MTLDSFNSFTTTVTLLSVLWNYRKDTTSHTKHRTVTESHNEHHQQRINNIGTTTLERTIAQATVGGGGGGLNAFHCYQIFALDYTVVEAQKC